MSESKTRSVVQLGLGANLGDRVDTVERAFDALDGADDIAVVAESSLYRTEARIVEDQPDFINACATIETGLEPRNLLEALHSIETAFGRARTVDKGPRRLDLDILLWEDRIVETDDLTIPHPGLADRGFVLVPLAEIAPDVRDPVSGRTVEELREDCRDTGGVEPLTR